MAKVYSLITVELTEDEQESLLGLIIQSTNSLIASDPNRWLPDLERVEEKINSAREASAFDNGRPVIIHDYRG